MLKGGEGVGQTQRVVYNSRFIGFNSDKNPTDYDIWVNKKNRKLKLD